MANDLSAYVLATAQRLVDQDGLKPAEALRQAIRLLNAARTAYRTLGAPLGDTDAGFIAWLQPRHRPPVA